MVFSLSPFFVAKITFALLRDSLVPSSSCTQTHPFLLPQHLLPGLCQHLFLHSERRHSLCPCFQCLPFNPAQQTRHRPFRGGVNHVMPWLGTSWLDSLFNSHFTYISKARGFAFHFWDYTVITSFPPPCFQIYSFQIHSLFLLHACVFVCVSVCITDIF